MKSASPDGKKPFDRQNKKLLSFTNFMSFGNHQNYHFLNNSVPVIVCLPAQTFCSLFLVIFSERPDVLVRNFNLMIDSPHFFKFALFKLLKSVKVRTKSLDSEVNQGNSHNLVDVLALRSKDLWFHIYFFYTHKATSILHFKWCFEMSSLSNLFITVKDWKSHFTSDCVFQSSTIKEPVSLVTFFKDCLSPV